MLSATSLHRAIRRAPIAVPALWFVGACTSSNESSSPEGSRGANSAGTSSTAGAASIDSGGSANSTGGRIGTGGTAGANGSDASGGSVETPSTGGENGVSRDGGSAGAAGRSDGAPTDVTVDSCKPCTAYSTPSLLANVQPAELAELSGMTASWSNPGVFFAHNDRARPDVYALDENGGLLAHFVLVGAAAEDIEDIGVGPCGNDTCLYLADIGNNLAPRDEYAVFRTPEPASTDFQMAGTITRSFERLAFTYDDGRHNAEGLLVEPRTGALYVVTKENAGQPSGVYALPRPPATDAVNVATRVADLPVPVSGNREVSAAAAHPCGTGFLLRTYDTIYEFRISSGAPFEEAFTATPIELASPDEPQSEAISYLADGSGFVTSGEGASAPIYRALCQ